MFYSFLSVKSMALYILIDSEIMVIMVIIMYAYVGHFTLFLQIYPVSFSYLNPIYDVISKHLLKILKLYLAIEDDIIICRNYGVINITLTYFNFEIIV